MESVIRGQILEYAVRILLYADTLEKVMILCLLYPAIVRIGKNVFSNGESGWKNEWV